MLRRLDIQNYAIIDSVAIDFSAHLNIITGETGAGKSILMGALGLILGDRADTSLLADPGKKCYVEGMFVTRHASVMAFLQAHELDHDEELVLRREVGVNGKSRAFINDTPVTLVQLRQLAGLLVDLHRQFDTLELGDHDFQREVIDVLAGNGREFAAYQSVYQQYRATVDELGALKETEQAARKEYDYHRFLHDELQEAGFSADEIERADADLRLASHAENIKKILGECTFELEESEQPLIQRLRSMIQKLQGIESFHEQLGSLNERLRSLQIELKDIASGLESVNETIGFDEEKVNRLNERIATGYRLLKKHGVTTTGDLLRIKDELALRLGQVAGLSGEISRVEGRLAELQTEAVKIAEEISVRRRKQARPFEEKVNVLLRQVGMPNARIRVNVTPGTVLHAHGMDTVEFLFNANVPANGDGATVRFEPLRKVASGGELSRLMLSITSLVAKSIRLPVLVFDEIDSGISGEAARQVGVIIKELSASHQVIAITHQPQIAAKAETHLFVYKEIAGSKIVTSVRELDGDERITAIARMLSGEKPTAAAFENAREMMGN